MVISLMEKKRYNNYTVSSDTVHRYEFAVFGTNEVRLYTPLTQKINTLLKITTGGFKERSIRGISFSWTAIMYNISIIAIHARRSHS